MRLRPEKTAGTDLLSDDLFAFRGKIFRSRIFCEKCFHHFIHSLVGALCRKYRTYKQMKRDAVIIQRAHGVRIVFFEYFKYDGCLFLFIHGLSPNHMHLPE